MDKNELVQFIATKAKVSKEDATCVLDTLMEGITTKLKQEENNNRKVDDNSIPDDSQNTPITETEEITSM